MCRLSWNLETSTSWKPQGLSRPVMWLLYFNITWRVSTTVFLTTNPLPWMFVLHRCFSLRFLRSSQCQFWGFTLKLIQFSDYILRLNSFLRLHPTAELCYKMHPTAEFSSETAFYGWTLTRCILRPNSVLRLHSRAWLCTEMHPTVELSFETASYGWTQFWDYILGLDSVLRSF
jgi:hypothetical protein